MSVKDKALAVKGKLFTNYSVTPKEQWGYAGGIFGNCMGQDCIGTYDDIFCRDYLGIDSEKMNFKGNLPKEMFNSVFHRKEYLAANGKGGLLQKMTDSHVFNMAFKGNVATILSFFIPPVAGAWYDSPTRGKRSHIRTALLYSPIPFAISSLLLFIVPSGSAVFNFFWALLLDIVFKCADTFYDIALAALGLRICSDPRDRKSFFTFSSWASTLGSMLPGWVIPVIVGTTDDASKQKWLYFLVAFVFCVLGVTSMYLPFITIRDKGQMAQADYEARKMQAEDAGIKVQWNRETVSAILHNRPFMVLQASLFFDMIRQITYKMLPYLYKDVFDDYKMKSIIDAVSGGLSYVGLASVPFISSRFSARNIVAGGYAYTGFMYLIMSLFNIGFDVKKIRSRRYIIGILIGLAGMPNAAQGAARKIITADSTDYMDWYGYTKFGTSIRSDGILSAAGSIISKAISLVQVNLYNGLFGRIGYQSETVDSSMKDVKLVQSDSTLRGIFAVITLCGLIGNLFSAITFLLDNYTGERKENIYAELCRLRSEKADEIAMCDSAD